MRAEPIAIVGLACRYPDATSPAQLWQNVLGRRRAFRRIPEIRLGQAYRGGPADPDLACATRAGVLRDWEFDRERFSIPGPLHRAADHAHWLALETAAEALVDAGFPLGDGLDRDKVGVVLGNSLTGEFSRAATLRLRWPFVAEAAAAAMRASGASAEWAGGVLERMERLVKDPFEVPGDETLTGALANTIAGRICNQFDLHGTGYTVDGACASSLLAVMTACRALACGEHDFMLAGGVDMSLDPMELVGFSRLGALATDEMRVYDARPTGFLPGEGCGVVALMRADDAERAGLRDYARIVGWASSSDGAGGLSRPARAGQVLALARAYHTAGLDPSAAGMVEGHGTGAAVGDRTELEALAEVRGNGASPAALGTIKANIGHTKAAAGVAGLLKAALAVHHRVIPPVTGCREPHELLRRDGVPLRLLDEPEPWPDRVPRAGISSMGFGGINAHLVIEGAGEAPAPAVPAAFRRWSARAWPVDIVFLSARTAPSLAARLRGLGETASDLSDAELGDLAGTAWREADGAVPFRAALVAADPAELASAAARAATACDGWDGGLLLDRQRGYVLGSGRPARVGLLFPGQAAPVRPELPGWAARLGVPVLGDVQGEAEGTALAQPAIMRQSLAGLAWLGELGTVAVAATGHSLGEITALHWGGALSARAAQALATERGRVMAEYGEPGTGMVSLAVSLDRLPALLDGTDAVSAGHNAPEQVVVSGRHADLELMLERALGAGIAARRLPVSHGFHSPAMAPVVEPLRRALERFEITTVQTGHTVLSTVTGEPLAGDDPRDLLTGQLTRPVLFGTAVRALAARCDLLVETGPGALLTGLAAANCPSTPAVAMDCGGDPRQHAFATAVLAAAAAADIHPWFAGRAFRTLPLDAEARFVANPCELGSGSSDVPAPRAQAPTDAPATPEDGPRAALVTHLAHTLELPPSSITASSTLLGDLHLNSLQVIQVVSAVAGGLGKRPPAIPPMLAEATVDDVAEILAGLPDTGGSEPSAPVTPVRAWVRAYTHHWVPCVPATGPAATVVTLAGHDGPGELAAVLRRAAAERPDRLVIVHNGHPAAAAIGRSVVAELESGTVVVADLRPGSSTVDSATLACPAGRRYLELRQLPGGGFERPETALLDLGDGDGPPLGEDDVCLVTGGVRGITAVAAAALAERTGCTLVFAGRSAGDSVADELRELPVKAHYRECDVADETAVRALVAEFGQIRGLLHGAGVNEPSLLGEVTADALGKALRPKVDGLRTLLDAVGDKVRLVLGFGSVIGRQGLAGESAYCVANDWLRVELERWASTHPGARTHALEWSVWSGTGMGVRMDALPGLRARGVEPIEPELGVAALMDLLADAGAPVTVLLTSRFPDSPALPMDNAGTSSLRFAERTAVRIDGVEAVIEAKLALGSDPYLDEHRVERTAVLPAVIGLEAMAQAVSLTGGPSLPLALSNVEFAAPVTVDERAGRTVQVAALACRDRVEVVLRDDSDGFGADRFTAVARRAPEPPRPWSPARPPSETSAHPWYGSLFFHSGRFRRVAGYELLTAFRVDAWLRTREPGPWFSQFHSGQLLLGDPAAHDACLHVLLACVPHRRALPVGVDRVTIWSAPPDGPLRVVATERAHDGDGFTFDVNLLGPDGTPVSRWEGLRLRALGPVDWPEGIPARLIGPWLSRRLIESGFADRAELETGPSLTGDGWAALPLEAHTGPLEAEDEAAAGTLADKTGEPISTTRAMVRAAREAATGPGPLRVDQVAEDGAAVAHVGEEPVLVTRIQVLESGVFAVAVTGR
ncbi:polyketide synthase family protein [Amycolatopsis speibonae]|uniref:SDR family NAD(P)-dependent oxidoreductase n=1 Tax=Amycolatopsis speibonae TaxID=1450224 RepID=A0ABV7NP65_9PSEU